MKKTFLALIILLSVSSVVYADIWNPGDTFYFEQDPDGYNDVLLGYDIYYLTGTHTSVSTGAGGGSVMFLTPVNGRFNITWSVNTTLGSSPFSLWCANNSGSSITWTQLFSYTVNGTGNYTKLNNTIASSNIGLCYFNGKGFFDFSSSATYATIIEKDKTYHNLSEGSLYSGFPLVTKFFSSTAGANKGSMAYIHETSTYSQSYSYTNSSYYYATYLPMCENPYINTTADEDYLMVIWDVSRYNASDSYYMFKYVTINPQQTLNISSFSPTNVSVIQYNSATTFNASIVPSVPSMVDNVCWYLDANGGEWDGGLWDCGSSSNYSASIYLAQQSEPYRIMSMVEDNDCSLYPYQFWDVLVGQFVNLSGTVKGRTNGGLEYPLENAVVQINSSGSSIMQYKWTDENGSYRFTGLPTGFYTITATAGNHIPYAGTINMSGESSFNNYVRNIVLNLSTAETINATIYLSCYANLTEADIKCDITTDLESNYYLTVVSPNGEYNSILLNGSTSAYLSDIIPVVDCGAIYRFFIAGYEEETQTDGIPTIPCSGSTTTTTWPYPYTTFTPQLNCIDVADEVDIECWYNTTTKYPILVVYKGVSYGVKSIVDSFYLGGGWGDYNGSLNLSDWFDGVDNPKTLQCGSWYWIYLEGYESITGQWVNTTVCNATVTTTIATPTTYPVPITLPVNFTVHTLPNATAVNISFNCTNLTGKILNGDIYHASLCPFILVLGVSLFYGLALLFVILAVFKVTESYVACSVFGLLYTSVFLSVLPQPTINYLSVGVAFTIGLGLYGLFRK